MGRTALVTGASGFIALHVVDLLLQNGWDVHATVRSVKNEAKTRPITALQDKEGSSGCVKLFEADLMSPGSFLEAMQGCSTVFHLASPCLLPEQIGNDPQKQVVEPALEGTRNVLDSVNQTPSVERVVLTSSEAATRGSNADALKCKNHTIDETNWNETNSLEYMTYQYSKTLAEREAWKIAEAQSRWKLVTILPAIVIGPSLTGASDSGSLAIFSQLMGGKFMFGAPDVGFMLVDVRDVALAHVRAAERDEANGRYLISAEKSVNWLEMAEMIRPVHQSPWKLPTRNIPGFILRFVAPLFGIPPRYVEDNLGIVINVDNSRSRKDLGITYHRSLEESFADHYRSWAQSP